MRDVRKLKQNMLVLTLTLEEVFHRWKGWRSWQKIAIYQQTAYCSYKLSIVSLTIKMSPCAVWPQFLMQCFNLLVAP